MYEKILRLNVAVADACMFYMAASQMKHAQGTPETSEKASLGLLTYPRVGAHGYGRAGAEAGADFEPSESPNE